MKKRKRKRKISRKRKRKISRKTKRRMRKMMMKMLIPGRMKRWKNSSREQLKRSSSRGSRSMCSSLS